MKRWGLCIVLVALMASAAVAKPKKKAKRIGWPQRLVEQPLVMPTGLVRVAGDTLGISLSRRAVGNPTFLAPDIYVGYRADLTLALLHDRGICFNEPCEGYRDMRLAALYRLATGPHAELAAIGAVAVPSTNNPFAAGLRGGLAARGHWQDFGVVFGPELYLGVVHRSRVADRLMLPFTFAWQQKNDLAWTLMFAWQGPLDGFSDAVEIPVGFGVSHRASKHVELGAEFRFENFFGRGATFDRRTLLLRLGFWY